MVIANRIRINVLARIEDPSWTTALSRKQIEDPAYCYTDLYIGAVEYYSSDTSRLVRVQAGTLAVVGHIAALARLLVAEADGTLETFRNEWVMQVSHHGDFVRLEPDRAELFDIDRAAFRLAVAETADTIVQFIRACQPPPHAEMVEELSRLAGRLRLHSL